MRAKKVKVPKMFKKVEEGIHNMAVASNMGWCAYCSGFTLRMAGPDDTGTPCPFCHNQTVLWHDDALKRGMYYF